jgi:hypothetical protein
VADIDNNHTAPPGHTVVVPVRRCQQALIVVLVVSMQSASEIQLHSKDFVDTSVVFEAPGEAPSLECLWAWWAACRRRLTRALDI